MRILIYYFTGSGNTKKVLNVFQNEFAKDGHFSEFVKIENQIYNPDLKKEINYDEYDLIGVGYPIHAFNAPEIMLDWAKSLHPLKETKRTFIINTSAEPLPLNNVSSIKLGKILSKKGFDIQNEYHYVMPYDMIFRHKQKMAYNMWHTAERLAKIDAKSIIEGKRELLKPIPCGSFFAWVMRIEHFGAKFNGLFYRVKSDTCIKCNSCMNNCPTHNIKYVNGKFKFGANCTMCQRCTYFCPTDSIKTGLFNTWRVNNPYTFEPTDDDTAYDRKIEMTKKERKRADFYNGFWCKDVYVRYFKEAEEKISEYEKNIE